MNRRCLCNAILIFLLMALSGAAAPVIDPIATASIPAGKTLMVPVTATSPNGRPLTFTASSSTNRITVEVHTNNPFWKMSVVQAAPTNAPGAFVTPFRGGAVSVTNVGDLTFMLFRDLTPHTVDVIQGLTAGGFYTSNTIFHRVIAGFMNQGGDPATNGTGGPLFRYDDEWNPQAIFSGNGQLALANSGKDTDGSQFFITVAPFRSGDFGYTLFGQLVRGFNVLSNINNTATDANSRPLADVIITKASFVPDNFDTVLTLLGTNLANVSGTISVIADDGAGGRATNMFTATTQTNSGANNQPFFYPNAVTHFVGPANTTMTNLLAAVGLDGETLYWFPYSADAASSTNIAGISGNYFNNVLSSPVGSSTNAQGQLQFSVVPTSNYVGTVGIEMYVSSSSSWQTYLNLGLSLPPYDLQLYTFTFGDTAITAGATNFTTTALRAFTNQLLATFTNGVPNSSPTNFTAAINWGDNVISTGSITTNLVGWKEVRGAHTYTNAGYYPVYVTIRSAVGATATAVATATVPPPVAVTRTGTNNIARWPAWAADFQLQTNASLGTTNWSSLTNFSTLVGYDNVITNSTINRSLFFRLKK